MTGTIGQTFVNLFFALIEVRKAMNHKSFMYHLFLALFVSIVSKKGDKKMQSPSPNIIKTDYESLTVTLNYNLPYFQSF